MSQTFDTTLNNIRWLLNDRDPGNYVWDRERIRRILNESVQRLTLDVGVSKTSQSVTLISGTNTYTLATASEYLSIHQIIDANGNPLQKLSLEQLHDFYGATDSGTPLSWALYPTDSASTSSVQKVSLAVGPTPGTNDNGDVLTVWYSAIPADITSESSGVGFTSTLLRALEKDVAVQLLAGATQAQQDKLGVSAMSLLPLWQGQVSDLVREARIIRRRMKRQDGRIVLGVQ